MTAVPELKCLECRHLMTCLTAKNSLVVSYTCAHPVMPAGILHVVDILSTPPAWCPLKAKEK